MTESLARPRPNWLTYGIAVALGAGTLVLHGIAGAWSGAPPTLVLSVPIILSSYVGGLGPGIVATTISAAGSAAFFLLSAPSSRPSVSDGMYWLEWAALVIGGLLISRLSDRLRRTEARADATQEMHAASEERFRQVAESIREVFWLTDSEDRHAIYVSPAYETIWGRSRESLYTSGTEWLETIHPGDRTRVDRAVRSRASGTYDEEYRIVRPDGSVRWIRDRGFPVRDGDGTTLRFAGVAEDITDRLELEAQLRQAQKMDSLGRLAGGVAHDFNNLLTAILGYCELALFRVQGGDDTLRDELTQIQRAGRQASALTGRLLTFSRPDLGQPVVLDLNTVIRNIDQMLQRMIGEEVRLAVTTEEAGGSWIDADPGQVEQVLMNLVVNARDAMPQGGTIAVRTAAVHLDAAFAQAHVGITPGPHVLLSVADEGCGIPREIMGRVFDPFFTTKPPGEGTGLGLSTVYSIVTNAKGAVDMESEVGRGSIFKVYWPSVEAAEEMAAIQHAEPGSQTGTETILVVEDDDSIRTMAARVLEEHGYSVLIAADAEQAERMADQSEQEIHLLFTDLVMPGADGRTLASRLRRSRPSMRILYTSGYTDRLGHTDAAPAGTLMRKPYTPTGLLQEVRSTFDSTLSV